MEKESVSETSVLIVDDNNQYAKVLEKILKYSFGYTNITHVDNTSEAYQMISNNPEKFELMFVDYNFPVGDTGGLMLEKLKAQNKLNEKAVFLMTADPTTENVNQAFEAGVIGIVAKPFNSAQLKDQINKAMKNRMNGEEEF